MAAPFLVDAMDRCKINPETLARRLVAAKVKATDTDVRRWKRGEAGPTVAQAVKVDAILGCNGSLLHLWWHPDEPVAASMPLGRSSEPLDNGPPEDRDVDNRSSNKNRGIKVTAAAITAALVAGVALALTAASGINGNSVRQVMLIGGYVTCSGTQPVEGVWIQTDGSGSGFALTDGNHSRKHFTYQLLHKGTAWTVHVGCGGTPQHWLYRPQGEVATTASTASWNCQSTYIGTCNITSTST